MLAFVWKYFFLKITDCLAYDTFPPTDSQWRGICFLLMTSSCVKTYISYQVYVWIDFGIWVYWKNLLAILQDRKFYLMQYTGHTIFVWHHVQKSILPLQTLLSKLSPYLHDRSRISPASWLLAQPFVQAQIKKNIGHRVAGLCDGNPSATGGFPSERASNAENVHFMTPSWENNFSLEKNPTQLWI